MEKLSTFLTNYILKKGAISEKHYYVYLYGFRSGLEILSNVICSAIIAVSLNMVVEGILFFAFFIPLRSYGGGLHMENYLACLLFSCMALACILLMVKHFSISPILSLMVIGVSMVVMKLTGPVSHPNRPVSRDENLRFARKVNLFLVLSSVAAFLLLLTDSIQYLFLQALVFALVCITSIFGKLKYS